MGSDEPGCMGSDEPGCMGSDEPGCMGSNEPAHGSRIDWRDILPCLFNMAF